MTGVVTAGELALKIRAAGAALEERFGESHEQWLVDQLTAEHCDGSLCDAADDMDGEKMVVALKIAADAVVTFEKKCLAEANELKATAPPATPCEGDHGFSAVEAERSCAEVTARAIKTLEDMSDEPEEVIVLIVPNWQKMMAMCGDAKWQQLKNLVTKTKEKMGKEQDRGERYRLEKKLEDKVEAFHKLCAATRTSLKEYIRELQDAKKANVENSHDFVLQLAVSAYSYYK